MMASEYCARCSGYLPAASDQLDQQDVMELAAAITRGDLSGARSALDTLFRADRRAEEWIAIAKSRVSAVDVVDKASPKLAAAEPAILGQQP